MFAEQRQLFRILLEVREINRDRDEVICGKGARKAVPIVFIPQLSGAVGKRRVEYQSQRINQVRFADLVFSDNDGVIRSTPQGRRVRGVETRPSLPFTPGCLTIMERLTESNAGFHYYASLGSLRKHPAQLRGLPRHGHGRHNFDGIQPANSTRFAEKLVGERHTFCRATTPALQQRLSCMPRPSKRGAMRGGTRIRAALPLGLMPLPSPIALA
jgi:hypothetical protein